MPAAYQHQQNGGGRRPGLMSRNYVEANTRGDKGNHSQLLDDFRNGRVPQPPLTELGPHVVEFCTDQHGSRFIQQKLERASEGEKEMIFVEILPHSHSLIVDVFGNYVIQKFFEFGTTEQKRRLAASVKGYVVQFALQM